MTIPSWFGNAYAWIVAALFATASIVTWFEIKTDIVQGCLSRQLKDAPTWDRHFARADWVPAAEACGVDPVRFTFSGPLWIPTSMFPMEDDTFAGLWLVAWSSLAIAILWSVVKKLTRRSVTPR